MLVNEEAVRAALHAAAADAPAGMGLVEAARRRGRRTVAARRATATAAVVAVAVAAAVVAPMLTGRHRTTGNHTVRVAPAVAPAGQRPGVDASTGPMSWPPLLVAGSSDTWLDVPSAARAIAARLHLEGKDVVGRVLWVGDSDGGPAAVVAAEAAGRVAVGAVLEGAAHEQVQGAHLVNKSGDQISVVLHVGAGAQAVDDGIIVAAPGRQWTVEYRPANVERWMSLAADGGPAEGRAIAFTVGHVDPASPPAIRLTARGNTVTGSLGADPTAQ